MDQHWHLPSLSSLSLSLSFLYLLSLALSLSLSLLFMIDYTHVLHYVLNRHVAMCCENMLYDNFYNLFIFQTIVYNIEISMRIA